MASTLVCESCGSVRFDEVSSTQNALTFVCHFCKEPAQVLLWWPGNPLEEISEL